MDYLLSQGTGYIGWPNLTGITGAATTHSSAAGAFAIKGRAFEHAVDSGVATPTTGIYNGKTGQPITLTAGKIRAVVFCLNASDAVVLVAGDIVDNDGFLMPEIPSIPDSLCPFAVVVAKAGSTLSGTFTVGSSNWSTTGMTYTVRNCALGMLDRPFL